MRMRAWVFAFILLAGLPRPVAAQRHHPPRQPAEGSLAIGGDVGAFLPSDGTFGSALVLEAHSDFYLTPRISIRFGVDWTDPPFERESTDSLRQVRLGGDVIYNWERIRWHPFVGAGIAAHILQQKDNGHDFDAAETEPGGAVLGGVEYFFHRATTLKAEGRYQFVGESRNGYDPSGFLLLVGLKQYF